MTTRLAAGLLLVGLSSLHPIGAQGVDPKLMSEVAAVRKELARSTAALRQYTWTEHTEVLVKGDVKSYSDVTCRYDSSGELIRTPAGSPDEKKEPNAVSKRHRTRKKADMQDYMERAVTLIHNYVPPKPEQIDALLQNGQASLGQSSSGKSEVRFKYYFKEGDYMAFTYDPVSKVLLRVTVVSNMGPKDPVTMEAVFETFPDGVNHLDSTTMNAKAKNVQVTTRNVMYKKVAN